MMHKRTALSVLKFCVSRLSHLKYPSFGYEHPCIQSSICFSSPVQKCLLRHSVLVIPVLDLFGGNFTDAVWCVNLLTYLLTFSACSDVWTLLSLVLSFASERLSDKQDTPGERTAACMSVVWSLCGDGQTDGLVACFRHCDVNSPPAAAVQTARRRWNYTPSIPVFLCSYTPSSFILSFVLTLVVILFIYTMHALIHKVTFQPDIDSFLLFFFFYLFSHLLIFLFPHLSPFLFFFFFVFLPYTVLCCS